MNENLKVGVRILDAIASDEFDSLDNLFQNGERSYLDITPVEHWNWLHKSLLGFNPNEPSRKMITYLISKGIDINAQDCYGMTPLHYALRGKNVEAALALLESGADPNIPNIDGVIPLAMIGGIPKELGLLKLMLDKGGNVHFFNGQFEVLESLKLFMSDTPDFQPVIALMEQYA